MYPKTKNSEYCWQHQKIGEKTNNQISEIKETKTLCVKVDNLRKHGYISLEDCLKNPENIYVGRAGRIWITEIINNEKSKRIFHYAGSKYGNPYKIAGSETAEIVCQKYKEYIKGNCELLNSLKELIGKTLCCFCDQSGPCHAKILVELISEIYGN